ncbi:hypothetical protein [Salinisphaera sp. Q1T1-3]|uniref:hypothetical protein n=1 Tax=Salinisphaera sp. Q1T1-3 TaxID=2321229 RepID=UPI000E72935A|nr:hypothetical protein [Salinisphaera sp. Q1T1-3]RJS92355.1 hypothetical protein D3260_11960 [Salinisphaera sp. Q1T1-3]
MIARLRARWRAAGRAGDLALLGLIYLVSRALAWQAGVAFHLDTLNTAWQLLDPEVLRHDLLAGVLHMPGQPPLYNLAIGALLKLGDALAVGPVGLTWIFRVFYGALALVAIALSHDLLHRARVEQRTALIVMAIFICSPAFVLYEAMPYYTLMVLAWLVLIACCLDRCLARPGYGRGLLLFLAMTGLIYTRSLFQIEWFIVLAVFVILASPGARRRVGLAALVPLVLILALYAKNVVLVGQFSTSDWLGLSLAKMTTLKLSPQTRETLIRQGRLSPLARDDRAYGLRAADIDVLGGPPQTGSPVLDTLYKSTGAVNYNYARFAQRADIATRDALATIRAHPGIFARSVGTAWLMFFRPASDYPLLGENRTHLAPWNRLYGKLIAGQPIYPQTATFALRIGHVGWFIMAGYLLAVGFGALVAIRCLRERHLSQGDALLLFCWLNVLYVSVVGNAFEIDENQRFRFAIEPFIAVLALRGLQAIAMRLRHRPSPS